MTKKNKLSSHKRLIIGAFFAIMIAVLFIASSVPATAGTGHSQQETGFTTTSYIPNPVMNTNITWSTFYNGWSPLEYNTSTRNTTLNTNLNPSDVNPISVNPLDINTSVFNQKIHGFNVFSKTNWEKSGSNIPTGTNEKITNTTDTVSICGNESNQGNYFQYFAINIPITDLPSNNPAFDYLSIIGNTTMQDTGMNAGIIVGNGTQYNIISGNANGTAQITKTTGGQETGIITKTTNFFASVSLKQAKLTLGTTNAEIGMYFNVPKSTNNHKLNITIKGVSVTTTPETLGTTSWGNKQVEQNYITGNANLSTLDPTFPWTSINNDGYTVATSQPLQNLSTGQTSINDGSYVEQVTYQGYEQLPTAPDLSYGATNIIMPINIPGNQFVVANVNGVSYLSGISIKDNGTYNFGTVNPNNQNNIVLEAKFTAQQWNASTSAPSFFSVQGLEYYWWVGLIGLMSVIGLGAAASSHFSGEEENLRIPKGKFGR